MAEARPQTLYQGSSESPSSNGHSSPLILHTGCVGGRAGRSEKFYLILKGVRDPNLWPQVPPYPPSLGHSS